jgi:hypothetical protein
MTIRRLALFIVLGVLAGVAVWLPGHLGHDAASPSASTPVPSTGVGTGSNAGVPATGEGSAPGVASGSSAPGQSASAAPGQSREILPQPSTAASPTAQGPAALKPAPATTAPLVTNPLPQGATRSGALVTGYPAALAPPKTNAVEISSVSPSGGVLQVALTARCSRPCSVLRTYRLRLAARGFAEVDAPSVENRPAASFKRGDDSVVVSVTGTTRSALEYAVFGVLHAQES